ncbi:type-F conjugative transfer system protein TraW [Parvularcula oceani]|uniref:type-F conjugative transfer system protein TraW n=1 Tax=Parvularcula oceani TaxID=1247963 RepID=UPI0004E157F7|nr:type-F conjugative transfer system protein TraW [Parvularcula oceani]
MYRAIAFAAWLALSSEAAAKDLGVRGAVFPVTEPDLFAEIAGKLARLEAAGAIDRINERLRQQALASAERPSPVPGLTRTDTPRRFHVDPTITVLDDIVTPDGQVIARAGERFNPLDYMPMRHTLLFFDGDDAGQVAWAKEGLHERGTLVSPILVAGPVLELTRDWERQVFFDQGGTLTTRFGITQVPARVSRDGNLLLVEEVMP